MKKNVHPERKAVKVIMNDGTEYMLKMALPNGATELRLEVDPTTHPAWRPEGGHQMLNSNRQLNKFRNKFASSQFM